MPLPLTKVEGAPERSQVKTGMAYFSGTGPPFTTCGSCSHRGYRRKVTRWNRKKELYEERTIKVYGCALFRTFTGRHGGVVQKEWQSCKYYEASQEAEIPLGG